MVKKAKRKPKAKPARNLKAAVKTAVVEADGTPKEGTQVATAFDEALKDDPKLINATNQEPWWQSGTGFFGAGGLAWSVFFLSRQSWVNGYDFEGYDVETSTMALGSMATSAGVLYRRYVPGLKPMFYSLVPK